MNNAECGMRNAESNGPADALRELCETFAKQEEEIAAAVFEGAEKLAETLAPLIEEAAKVLAKILPLVIEEVRRRAAYLPTKKDAPKTTGRPHAAPRTRTILRRARSGI